MRGGDDLDRDHGDYWATLDVALDLVQLAKDKPFVISEY
jgi:hypothetical protein